MCPRTIGEEVIPLLLTILPFNMDPRPDESTSERFPESSVIYTQLERTREHLVRVKALKQSRDWEGGIWEDAVRETEFNEVYWETLDSIHSEWGTVRRNLLYGLKKHIGDVRFLQGWNPPLIPEESKFLFPLPKPKPKLGVWNANGTQWD